MEIKIIDGKIYKIDNIEEISVEQLEQENQNTRDQLTNDISQAQARIDVDTAIIKDAENQLAGLDNTLKEIKKGLSSTINLNVKDEK